MSTGICVCLIVRDEEEHLARCLASVAGVASDVVVVDTGSKDRTPEIARAHGARMLSMEWPRDFSVARNASLEAATGAWCLVLDADEELPEETRAGLAGVVAGAEAAGVQAVSMAMRNLNRPGELTAWDEFPIVRLFRRAAAHRYEGAIHEQVTPSIVRAGGRIGTCGLHILHHGYARPLAQGGASRVKRNLALLQDALRASPDDAYLEYQVGVTLKSAQDAGAAAHLERALVLGGLSGENQALARMKLAQLCLARGDDAGAVEQAGLCLAFQPGNPAALQVMSVACATLGRLPAAVDALKGLLACKNLAPANRRDAEMLMRALGGVIPP
jgi:hypothetical protein